MKSGTIWTRGSLSFWSWNDKLQSQSINEQLDRFQAAGMSGVFLHARGGLEVEYLGEEWMDAVAVCVEHAKNSDLEIWLYDEDAWPSGFCGGKVPQAGEEHQQKWLKYAWIKGSEYKKGHRTIACYRQDENGDWKAIPDNEGCESEELILHVYYEVNPYYSDLLNPATVRLFIDSTYEAYRQRFSEHFGTRIKGIFTDEPQYAIGQFPWSSAVEAEFVKQQGRSITEILPQLLLNKEGVAPIRHAYWKTISTCFTQSFAQQIGMWCENHQLCFTGHFAAEDTLRGQMNAVADVMRKYEWMHMPGIDHLGKRLTRPVVLKQVSSVARQLGKKQVLSEMFGCSGWGATLADFKYIADWHYSMGVNVQCQHLAAYSLRGSRKRDYPPSLSYQQPWWNDFDLFTRYADGLQGWLHKGQEVAEVLVIHPLTSAWCLYDREQSDHLWELDRRFGEISELLLQMNISYDYGDESLLEKYGSVTDGQVVLGHMRYAVIVLPSLVSIEAHTFKVLQQFHEEGGTIIGAGHFPSCIAGEVSEALQHWCREHVLRVMPTRKAFDAALSLLQPQVRIFDQTGKANDSVYSYMRRDGEETVYFLLNTSEDTNWNGHLVFAGAVNIVQIDPSSGERTTLAVVNDHEQTVCLMQLACRESALLLTTSASPRPAQVMPVEREAKDWHSLELSAPWRVHESTENHLTLDSAQYRIVGQTQWSESMHHLAIQEQLSAQKQTVTVELKYTFELAASCSLDVPIKLALEDWGQVELICNGQSVEKQQAIPWFDPAIDQVRIENYLQLGCNELVIRRVFRNGGRNLTYLADEEVFETEKNRFHQETELECLYIIGNFAVVPSGQMKQIATRLYSVSAEQFALAAIPEKVYVEDLTPQGFCFFAGSVILEQTCTIQQLPVEAALRINQPLAVVVAVSVNGQLVGQAAWSPYVFNVTSFLRVGNNKIELRLTSGLRNLLGPHHHFKGDAGFVGPSLFKGKRGWEDHIYSYNPPDSTWREAYHFTSFGTGSTPVLTLRYENKGV